MPSLTEENYLKAIYVLNHTSDSTASTNAIAERISAKASSVTDMLKRLNEKKLVNYKKYQAVTLTKEGEKVAISIIRKHRLWEYFLVENLKFGWDEVHELAEQLEHIRSVKLTNKLEEYLNFPTHDPHGDPIPDKNGRFPSTLKDTLANCEVGKSAIVVGVKDHSSNFLNYLNKHSIKLGTVIKLVSKDSFDSSQEIELDQKKVISISAKVSENLFINLD